MNFVCTCVYYAIFAHLTRVIHIYTQQRRRLQEDLESAATRLGMAQPVST
jgi:hypothetical protein